MHDVIWLFRRTLMLAIKILALLAKGLPHTKDPIASSNKTNAKKPYAQRRRAGDASAFMSKLMADSTVVVIAQSHAHDIT
jgi:hypothetical protein